MRVTMRASDAGMKRRNAVMLSNSESARRRGAAIAGALVSAHAARLARVATGRYRNGFIQAHNTLAGIAGVPPMHEPPLNARANLAGARETLQVQKRRAERQLRFHTTALATRRYEVEHYIFKRAKGLSRAAVDQIRQSYLRTGRDTKDTTQRKHLRRIRQAIEALERIGERSTALDEAERSGIAFIAMGTRNNAKTRITKSKVLRIVTQQFGGTATIQTDGRQTYAEMRNLEPHARIANRRDGTVNRASALARRVGVSRIRPAFLKMKTGR